MTKLTPQQQYVKAQVMRAHERAQREGRVLPTGRVLSEATVARIRVAAERFELQHGPSYCFPCTLAAQQLAGLKGFPGDDMLFTNSAGSGKSIVIDSPACSSHTKPLKPKATNEDRLVWVTVVGLGILAGMALYASAKLAGAF